jgi:hypothetical protein
MKRFTRPPEPPDFDAETRQPGGKWLAANLTEDERLPSGTRPPDRWSRFRTQLADGFGGLCSYMVMYASGGGTVDHYYSCENYPCFAYEWSNYRYVMGWINSSKGSLDDEVLDPFDVQDPLC